MAHYVFLVLNKIFLVSISFHGRKFCSMIRSSAAGGLHSPDMYSSLSASFTSTFFYQLQIDCLIIDEANFYKVSWLIFLDNLRVFLPSRLTDSMRY